MPPTSERSFDQNRVQNVTSKREPIYADFSLPELQDLKNLRGPQRQAKALEDSGGRSTPALGGPRYQEPEYTYEDLMVQPDTNGGFSHWESGMGYGMRTAPVAQGTRAVRNPNYRGPGRSGGIGGIA